MGSSGDPQSLHRYLYANADPVNFTDPTGMYSLAEGMTVLSNINWTRAAAGAISGGLQGGLLGSAQAFGKAAILEKDFHEILNDSVLAFQTGFTTGAIIGGVTGGFGVNVATICGTRIGMLLKVVSVIGAGMAGYEIGPSIQ